MRPITLIREKSELRGTCYFELLPGKYGGKCWTDKSVYLAEEVFSLIEPIFARRVPMYDHYSFVGIRRPEWDRILADFDLFAKALGEAESTSDLNGYLGFLFTTSQEEFSQHFRTNADALADLLRNLIGWLTEQLRSHECISVLGM
jgi:hypothetical protein